MVQATPLRPGAFERKINPECWAEEFIILTQKLFFFMHLKGVICGTQNRLRMHGKYLNVFGEYAERIYAYMEKTQKGSWRILITRQET